MWIAKNSITGTTYGNKFDSIYDCQAFIDKELILLEYEFRRCFALEYDVLYHINSNGKSLFQLVSDAVFEFGKSIEPVLKTVVDFSLQGKKQKEIDSELHRIACLEWQKNNIIRCYNTGQKRFADGFDF